MTLKEIRESELLEYYALDLLTEKQRSEVEQYLVQYPDLNKDYLEIQQSLQSYAQSQGVAPKRDLKSDILNKVKPNIPPSNKNAPNADTSTLKYLIPILGLALLGATYFAWKTTNEYNDLQVQFEDYKTNCEEENIKNEQQVFALQQLTSPGNRSLKIEPTNQYPETDLILHTNNATRKNFIQVTNLPNISEGQAYQLWSLKRDTPPIPLTVFGENDASIIPIDFEEGTGTYAITIEQEGGAQTPNLDQLIGTVTL